jgi:hypothetical protein
VAACLICYFAGWRGTDWAAQVYRSAQVARYGVTEWDPGWYGGTYPLNYSLVYPLVAAHLGLWPLAGLSSAGATLAFDRLVAADLGRRPAGSWYFAISTVIEVAIGQLPTLTGEALALGSVVCFAHHRSSRSPHRSGWAEAIGKGGGLGLGVLAALSTPVAGAFLSLALCAIAITDFGRSPRRAWSGIGAAAVVMASTAVLPVVFPGAGYFPFPFGDLLAVIAISAVIASPFLAAPRVLQVGALLYAAVSMVLFVVPTQMGDNDGRLAAYIGTPLIICYLPRLRLSAWARPQPDRHSGGWRGHGRSAGRYTVTGATLVVVLAVVWAWGPIVESLDGATNGRSSVAAFYQPLVDELDELSQGAPVRLEVPPAAHHWESAYLAPKFSLARGWERQLDLAYDGIFYTPGALNARTYRSWLLTNGVSYVALADAPLDFAATAEAALLRSGTVPGLQPVWHSSSWELWRVTGSPGLASGPARVTALSPRAVLVRFSSAGASVVRLRWSPYWALSGVAGRVACLMRAPGGWTEVMTAYPGQFHLELSVFGAYHGNCRALVNSTQRHAVP